MRSLVMMTVAVVLLSAGFVVGSRQLAPSARPVPLSISARPTSDVSRRKVLIIGIDGCRWDAVEAAATPNLHQLADEGMLAINTDVLGPRDCGAETLSGPGWSNILTGVWPDKHGVRDNSFRGANYGRYPHLFRHIKAALPKSRTASLESWGAIHHHIVEAADLSLVPRNDEEDYETGDERVVQRAKQTLTADDPDALFVYLGNVDATGHNDGFHPAVAAYRRAIENADRQIGDVLATLRGRPTYAREDWLILVCTDHGGVGTNHEGGHNLPEVRRVFLIVSGPAASRGIVEEPTYVVDVAATALMHLGVPALPEWELDGRPVGLRDR